jgi:hypothetical protein
MTWCAYMRGCFEPGEKCTGHINALYRSVARCLLSAHVVISNEYKLQLRRIASIQLALCTLTHGAVLGNSGKANR